MLLGVKGGGAVDGSGNVLEGLSDIVVLLSILGTSRVISVNFVFLHSVPEKI